MKDWQKLEDLAHRTEQLANMAGAIYSAMFQACNASDDYDNALHFFVSLMMQHRNDMKTFFEEVHHSSILPNGSKETQHES